MNIILRSILVLSSTLSVVIVARISRKSGMELRDAINWILVIILFLVFALFPHIISILASKMGIVDETNALYLLVIAILIAIVFYLNIRISRISMQLRNLVQELGINGEKRKKSQ